MAIGNRKNHINIADLQDPGQEIEEAICLGNNHKLSGINGMLYVHCCLFSSQRVKAWSRGNLSEM